MRFKIVQEGIIAGLLRVGDYSCQSHTTLDGINRNRDMDRGYHRYKNWGSKVRDVPPWIKLSSLSDSFVWVLSGIR